MEGLAQSTVAAQSDSSAAAQSRSSAAASSGSSAAASSGIVAAAASGSSTAAASSSGAPSLGAATETESPRARARRIFGVIDVNGDGSLTSLELLDYLKTNGVADQSTASRMFAALDADHNRLISLEEWVQVFAAAFYGRSAKPTGSGDEAQALSAARARVEQLAAAEAEAATKVEKATGATKAARSAIAKKRLADLEAKERAIAERFAAER